MISPIRFFIVSPVHSRYMLAAMLGVVLSGGALLAADPAKGPQVLGPLALLQMLAASTGFAVSARRGHFDLLLTAGASRLSTAVTHLAMSVLPGLVAWCALGAIEMLIGGTASPRAFATGSVVAMISISVLAWAFTVRLPRLSGGIAWLLGIATWVVSWADGLRAVGSLSSDAEPIVRVAVITMCPFVVLGRPLSRGELAAAVPLMLLSAACAAAAVAWMVRMDVPLESAQ